MSSRTSAAVTLCALLLACARSGADGLCPLGQNGSEALGAPLEDAEGRIEPVREPRGRRRKRKRDELADQRRAELAEVRLEITVEVGAVRLLSIINNISSISILG